MISLRRIAAIILPPVAAALVLLSMTPAAIAAGPKSDIVVTVKKGENVRVLAEKYLQNPDLWGEILKANKLKSVAEVQPGMKLTIPTAMIFAAEEILEKAQDEIHKATEAGARLFAVQMITSAIDLRNKALTDRKRGNWPEAIRLAEEAIKVAQKAEKESRIKGVVAAEAMLKDKRGTVQSRKPSDAEWITIDVKDVLLEQEKVRTLSKSMADILLKDESRLRLTDNSQAIIQKMTMDLLEKKQEATVSLIEGDLEVLLAGNKKKSSFDLEVKDIKTTINSNNFWVDSGAKETKFANYEGELEIEAAGGRVVLEKNSGALVKEKQKPTAPIKLLPGPQLLYPSQSYVAYNDAMTLKWDAVEGAKFYQVEVGAERSNFSNLYLSKSDLDSRSIEISKLPNGVYYWRVSAIDGLGFKGAKSETRWFKVSVAQEPPYLVVHSPQRGLITRKGLLEVSGEIEASSQLTINDSPVKPQSDGRFGTAYDLKVGLNTIEVKVTSEAGISSSVVRSVLYLPDEAVVASLAPGAPRGLGGEMLVATDGFTLYGSTVADASVEVNSDGFNARAQSSEDGNFRLSVPLQSARQDFSVVVRAPSGYVRKESLSVSVDQSVPRITLTPSLPIRTRTAALAIAGVAEGAASLSINNTKVKIGPSGGFNHEVTLSAGANDIVMIAESITGVASVLRGRVTLDSTPPALGKMSLSAKSAKAGDVIDINAEVREESGLARSSACGVTVGGVMLRPVLRACDSGACYSGSLVVPPGVSGDVALVDIELADSLGNIKKYNLK